MFERPKYLQMLIDSQHNGLVKVVTGMRRCGKSYLLNRLFYGYLIKSKEVDPRFIIRFAFDSAEDVMRLDAYLPEEPTRIKKEGQWKVNYKKFVAFIKDQTANGGDYYFLLDEIQILDEFVSVLNGFLQHENYDVFVTGSNSRFLSSEVDTEFGGRGYRIHLLPLSFEEYLAGSGLSKQDALQEFIRYGGIPLVQLSSGHEGKAKQAISVYRETYLKDILLRHPRVSESNLDDALKVIASMISAPLNPIRIENTFKSTYGVAITNSTIDDYIRWFEEAYLLNKALRYDIKGRKYIGSPYKIYFEDVGIRNAILNFREVDETDIIENIVYNELRYRGFSVDVGVVYTKRNSGKKDVNGKDIYVDVATEVDFVANNQSQTYYVQVALRIDTEEKKNQEYDSIRHIPDSFRKIIVVKDEGLPYHTNEGFLRISLLDFLQNPDSLNM